MLASSHPVGTEKAGLLRPGSYICKTANMSNEFPKAIYGQSPNVIAGLGSPNIRLVLPSEKFAESFFEAMVEFAKEGNPQIPPGMTQADFPAYLQRLHDQSMGKNLKEGHVPSKEFWIADADGFAGRIILGLAYIPSPSRCGHHVGYAVRHTKRRKSYATQALRLLLNEAISLHIYQLMPTCAASNLASRKVIERNGGVLQIASPNDDRPDRELRYLIDLTLVGRTNSR